MATPPTRVASYESAVTTSGTSFGSTATFAVQAGDVLLVYGRTYDGDGTDLLPNNPDSSGTEPTWTTRQSIMISGYGSSKVWTGPVTVTENITITLTGASGLSSHTKSFTAYVFRDHGGVGVSGKANANGATPALTLTGVSANSAIFTGNDDWNATAGARTPITADAGAYTEDTYATGTDYVSYDGFHADAGAAGSKGLGWTAPAAQRYAIIGVEILGTAVATVTGTVTSSLGGLAASASGTRTTAGAAAAPLGGLSATATGTRTTSGSAVAPLGALTASASGTRSTAGTAAAPLGALTATAAGTRSTAGTAAAPLGGLTATASGTRSTAGTATAPLGGLTATASGTRTTTGTASASLGELTASASGTRTADGTASAALGGLVATAAGVTTHPGTATASLGALTATATGLRAITGTAAAPLGALTATASGTRSTTGTASSALGALSAGAVGVGAAVVPGTAAAALGALSATATGARSTTGTASAPLGSLAATASGTRTTSGTAAAPLGALTAAASGLRVVGGEGVSLLGALTAHAAGTGFTTVPGQASATLGGLTAHAVGTGTPPQGSWYKLLAILRDAGHLPPGIDLACPNDGTPYRAGPDGQPYCPFDGYRPLGPGGRDHPLTLDWGGLLAALAGDPALYRLDLACPNDGEPYRTDHNGQLVCPFDGYRPGGALSPAAGGDWGGLATALADEPARQLSPYQDGPRGWGPST